jgi:hypothetical protein
MARRVWQRLIEEEGAQVAESSVRAMVAALKRFVGCVPTAATTCSTAHETSGWRARSAGSADAT